MSAHNICFHREIRKIICGYPLISVAVNLHDMSNPILWGKRKKKYFKMSSAGVFTQHVEH